MLMAPQERKLLPNWGFNQNQALGCPATAHSHGVAPALGSVDQKQQCIRTGLSQSMLCGTLFWRWPQILGACFEHLLSARAVNSSVTGRRLAQHLDFAFFHSVRLHCRLALGKIGKSRKFILDDLSPPILEFLLPCREVTLSRPSARQALSSRTFCDAGSVPKSELPGMVAVGPVWLLSTYDVSSVMEQLNFQFNLI